MFKLIATAQTASFSAEDTRVVGMWIEARDAKNFSKK